MKSLADVKASVIILFLILMIPIPFSVLSWIGTIMSLAAMGGSAANALDAQKQSLATSTMLLAGTYLVPYLVSLVISISKKRLIFWSFLPMIHILLFVICFISWIQLG